MPCRGGRSPRDRPRPASGCRATIIAEPSSLSQPTGSSNRQVREEHQRRTARSRWSGMRSTAWNGAGSSSTRGIRRCSRRPQPTATPKRPRRANARGEKSNAPVCAAGVLDRDLAEHAAARAARSRLADDGRSRDRMLHAAHAPAVAQRSFAARRAGTALERGEDAIDADGCGAGTTASWRQPAAEAQFLAVQALAALVAAQAMLDAVAHVLAAR